MSDAEEKKPAPGKMDFNINQIVFELWNGKKPLFEVFWIYYFAVVFGLFIAGSVLAFLGSMFALLKIIWAGFMVKPIWLASDHYKGPKHWALLAKVAAVLICLGAVGDLLA